MRLAGPYHWPIRMSRLVLRGSWLLLASATLALPGAAIGSRIALPYLGSTGIGPARFGFPEKRVLSLLRPSLGRPNAIGINSGCGRDLTEVAWQDLIAEFRSGRFSGYRLIRGGWPLKTPGSPHDRVTSAAPVPPLRTAAGITVGNTFGELRSAYGRLTRTGALRWTAANRLTFSMASTVANPTSAANPIVEIQTGTCGDF
jgi:hypothetical protein